MRKEYDGLRADAEEGMLAALDVAIYLEDAYGITLPDDLIDAEHLGTLAAVERVLDTVPREG